MGGPELTHRPCATVTEFDDTKESYSHGEIDIMDEMEGILGIDNEEKLPGNKIHGHLSWDFMNWESGFHNAEEEDEEDEIDLKVYTGKCFEEEREYNQIVKKENLGFWQDDEKRVSLNLNLNYQDVLDAWSDRGPLCADDYSISMASNGYYVSIQLTYNPFLLLLVSVSYSIFKKKINDKRQHLRFPCFSMMNILYRMRNCLLYLFRKGKTEKFCVLT